MNYKVKSIGPLLLRLRVQRDLLQQERVVAFRSSLHANQVVVLLAGCEPRQAEIQPQASERLTEFAARRNDLIVPVALLHE